MNGGTEALASEPTSNTSFRLSRVMTAFASHPSFQLPGPDGKLKVEVSSSADTG